MAAMTPDQIKSTFAKAHAAQQARQFSTAVKLYQRILKAAPNLAEVHFNLGVILTEQSYVKDAAGAFEAALKLKPLEPAIWLSYFELAARHPRVDNLRALIKRSAGVQGLEPGETYYRALAALPSDADHAERLLGEAIAKGFKRARAHIELGKILREKSQNDDALQQFDTASELEPKNAYALSQKAELLRNMGRFDEAIATIERAIEIAPQEGAHYYTYASIRKVAADDPMIDQMQRLFKKKSSTDPSLGHLGYALAKAMEDTGQAERMFGFLDRAAKNVKTRYPFDLDAEKSSRQSIKELHARLAEVAAPPKDAPRTIFVSGFPRSGTTLVEQIISSHSMVTGGGELGLLGPKITHLVQQAGSDLIDPLRALQTAGEEYRTQLKERFTDAPFVTDKSISTILTVGLVSAAVPDCRIVLVRRDPRDNALSIYKNFFEEGRHRYSNDLTDIAEFMRLTEGLLEYWSQQAAQNFLEVKYEDVVADLDHEARKIIAYCDLEWEEACLDFHANKRRVDTLSSAQVRQPLYSSSVAAWQRYEDDLKPFTERYLELGGTLSK